jgi:hypothetical protein
MVKTDIRNQFDQDTNSWSQFRASRASYGGESAIIANGVAATEEWRKKERRGKEERGDSDVLCTLVTPVQSA